MLLSLLMASRYSSCASMTQIRAPISPKIASRSKDGSIKSTWPGKSQTWKSIKELHLSARVRGKECSTYCIESFCILAVDSRNKVSFGGILWKTTLDIEDLPLLFSQRNPKIRWIALTVADPSIIISACLSQRDQAPVLELCGHLFFGY